MQSHEIAALYDRSYAEQYDREYLDHPLTRPNTESELALLAELVGPETTWLDVACGTGFFLAQHPQARRAGLDLSSAMLDVARARNPDVAFRQGDFRLPQPDWVGAWSLVSCMWGAYSYVESMREVRQVLDRLVEWVAPGGTLFLPVIDLEELTQERLKYARPGVYLGDLWITGITWSWTDGFSGRLHEQMVAPSIYQIIDWLQASFARIEIKRYSRHPDYPDFAGRKVLIARGRRGAGEIGAPAEVCWEEEVPEGADGAGGKRAVVLHAVPAKELAKELARRVRRRLLGR